MGESPIRFHAAQGAIPLIVLVAGTAAVMAQERAPVPNAPARARAQKLFREVYGKEYDAAESSAEKAALARKLLGQAADIRDDPAGHFVLLRIAKDVAVLAGDARIALDAVDRVIETYDVDPVKTKLACLRAVAPAAKSSSQHGTIARQAFSMVDAAMAKDDFESARELGDIAGEAARKARDYALRKQIVGRLEQLQQAEEAYTEYRKALVALEQTPTDPQANLSAGRYFCLTKGDWDRGIPMLALGSDQALKTLAVKELEETASPEDRIALADGWWDCGSGCEGREKEAIFCHAGELYEKALPNVSSTLLRAKLTKRLDEIAAIAASHGPIRDPKKDLPLPRGPRLGIDVEHEVTQVSPVDHVLQVWRILPEYSEPGRYRLRIKHAVAGQAGAFYMTVWTDLNGDGLPDTEIARSPKMVATADGQWSTWEFVSKVARIYVGNFTESKATRVYYATSRPAGYQGLSTTVWVSRDHRRPPNDKADPRCTNIHVQRIK